MSVNSAMSLLQEAGFKARLYRSGMSDIEDDEIEIEMGRDVGYSYGIQIGPGYVTFNRSYYTQPYGMTILSKHRSVIAAARAAVEYIQKEREAGRKMAAERKAAMESFDAEYGIGGRR